MIALSRQEGGSFLHLTGDIGISISLESETIAFVQRVDTDGGKVLDPDALDAFYKYNKTQGLYNSLQFAVRKQFGYKVENGNIIKIYDASKNGNDLIYDVDSGLFVPESQDNEMFFLNNSWYSDELVNMPLIGDKFTFVTDINHPDPETNSLNYIFGIGQIEFWAGGSNENWNNLGQTVKGVANFQSAVGSFNNSNDAGTLRSLDYRYNKNVQSIIRKDGMYQGVSNDTLDISLNDSVTKIVYGSRVEENIGFNADCYLNKSYFYNTYLTEEQTEGLNALN